jgi:hypothetical protein
MSVSGRLRRIPETGARECEGWVLCCSSHDQNSEEMKRASSVSPVSESCDGLYDGYLPAMEGAFDMLRFGGLPIRDLFAVMPLSGIRTYPLSAAVQSRASARPSLAAPRPTSACPPFRPEAIAAISPSGRTDAAACGVLGERPRPVTISLTGWSEPKRGSDRSLPHGVFSSRLGGREHHRDSPE